VAHPLRLDVALFLTQEQKVVRTGLVGKAMPQAVDEKERGPRKALGWFGVIHFKRRARLRGAKEPDGICVAYFPLQSGCPASDRSILA
jgi:hypothetical protein